jgi:membrane-associated protease RseP (regulator of RpoE activity)
MKILTSVAVGLILVWAMVLGGCASSSVSGTWLDGEIDGEFRIASGRSPELVVANANGSFTVSLAGRSPQVEHDRQAVPADRLSRSGIVYTVLDAGGDPMFGFAYIRRGSEFPNHLVYSPDFDPYTSYARIGASLGTADGLGVNRFELAANTAGTELEDVARDTPEKIIVVSSVRTGTAAAKAGLRKYDIVTHLDGQPVKSTNELNGIVTGMKVGETVVIRVMRDRAPLDISVGVGERMQWPRPSIVESTYRRVIG